KLSISTGKRVDRVHLKKRLSLTIATLTNNDCPIGLKSFIDNDGTLTLTNSTVSGNRANFAGGSKGGGIFNLGTLTLTNSTVSGNTVTHGYGGGIFNGGTLTLSNSTVSGNSASSSGGGIFTNF